MTDPLADRNPHFARLLPLLVCPDCRGELTRVDDAFRCTACAAAFPITHGVPMFARFGSAENWGREKPEETSEEYQKNYQELQEAAKYNQMYSGRWSKRIITRWEYDLLERQLASQPRSTVLLDLPSGGGRLSPQIARHTDLLIDADIALGQVRYGMDHGRVDTPQAWLTASGFHLPFRDASVDGVVCVRLNHHLPTADERERLVRELLRVARRFVIMTFFDHHSLKNRLRRLRRPFDGKPPKMTMAVDRVRELAAEGGADLVDCPALSHIGSGHRYGLLVKRPGK
jgi:SAM-dependent methyltransferase